MRTGYVLFLAVAIWILLESLAFGISRHFAFALAAFGSAVFYEELERLKNDRSKPK
jgi:hypothetical protein